jgi:ABC-type glycerol-3-phosphate transport system substrate-binding protein
MEMKFTGAMFIVAGLLIIQGATGAWAQGKKPATLAELASYTGPDREQRLLAGAKAEGKVIWYTSLAGSSYKELAKGFETKYPGIKIEAYRGTSTDIMTRLSAEAQAKQILADVLETTVPPLTTCGKISCWFLIPRLFSKNTRPAPKKVPAAGSSTGPSIAKPIAA